MMSCMVSILPTLSVSEPPFSICSKPAENKGRIRDYFTKPKSINQGDVRCDLTLPLLIIVYDFSLTDPFHITFEVLIQLLGFPQLLELSSGLGFFSLFCELSGGNLDKQAEENTLKLNVTGHVFEKKR